MKIFGTLLFLLVLITPIGAVPPAPSVWSAPTTGDPYTILSGEHTPLIWSDADTLPKGGTSVTTPWMQIGWTPTGNYSSFNVPRYNPESFTLTLRLDRMPLQGDDSVALGSARFECVYDTTDTTGSSATGWNADSSNVFVSSGNYNRIDYGVWTFETIAGLQTTYAVRKWIYPLRVLRGGYIRFVFTGRASSFDDTTRVIWTFTGEH